MAILVNTGDIISAGQMIARVDAETIRGWCSKADAGFKKKQRQP